MMILKVTIIFCAWIILSSGGLLTEGGSALQKHYVVAEQLFETQAYRVVSNAGPSGMTSSVRPTV